MSFFRGSWEWLSWVILVQGSSLVCRWDVQGTMWGLLIALCQRGKGVMIHEAAVTDRLDQRWRTRSDCWLEASLTCTWTSLKGTVCSHHVAAARSRRSGSVSCDLVSRVAHSPLGAGETGCSLGWEAAEWWKSLQTSLKPSWCWIW